MAVSLWWLLAAAKSDRAVLHFLTVLGAPGLRVRRSPVSSKQIPPEAIVGTKVAVVGHRSDANSNLFVNRFAI